MRRNGASCIVEIRRRKPPNRSEWATGLAKSKTTPASNLIDFPNRFNVVHEEGLEPAAEAEGRSEGLRTSSGMSEASARGGT